MLGLTVAKGQALATDHVAPKVGTDRAISIGASVSHLLLLSVEGELRSHRSPGDHLEFPPASLMRRRGGQTPVGSHELYTGYSPQSQGATALPCSIPLPRERGIARKFFLPNTGLTRLKTV